MNKKKICWITPDCFIDCDLNYYNMHEILKHYDIHWIVLFSRNNRFKESDFERIKKDNDNLTIEFLYFKLRMRNPMNIGTYIRLGKAIMNQEPDIIYMNSSVSLWELPVFYSLPMEHYIQTAHQGEVHVGMKYKKLLNVLRRLVYSRVRYVNMFSKSQAELFQKRFPNSRVFKIPLALKDFGVPSIEKTKDGIIRFLSFGTINYAKNIDLLIDAACVLYDKGYRNFRVSINGMCKDWSFYQSRIKYPEIFDIDIRSIDNSEIANLFVSADYFVQPYRVVSQSGPTKIAFNYNLPIIASYLPGFSDEILENVNGYLFEPGNINDLVRVMASAIDTYTRDYSKLKASMAEHTERYYSAEKIASQYIDMFDEVLCLSLIHI